MYDPNRFEHLTLDEVRKETVKIQADVAELLASHDVDITPIRFHHSLRTVANNAWALLNQDNQLANDHQELIDYILRAACRLYFWLQASAKRHPGFQKPVEEWASHAQMTPHQFFWLMANYAIRTPIGGILGCCELLADGGVNGTRFAELQTNAAELWDMSTEFFSYANS